MPDTFSAHTALMLPSIRTKYENRDLVSQIRQLKSKIEALKTL